MKSERRQGGAGLSSGAGGDSLLILQATVRASTFTLISNKINNERQDHSRQSSIGICFSERNTFRYENRNVD